MRNIFNSYMSGTMIASILSEKLQCSFVQASNFVHLAWNKSLQTFSFTGNKILRGYTHGYFFSHRKSTEIPSAFQELNNVF